MIRVPWDLEEAVALFDLYFRLVEGMDDPQMEIEALSGVYSRRAEFLGVQKDEKFRNISGLKKQLACIHYIVTDGQAGMSNGSKLFYETYHLYRNDRAIFNRILNEFVTVKSKSVWTVMR